MTENEDWKLKELINPCPRCSATDIRRIYLDPLKEIWVCYGCGQAQYIVKGDGTELMVVISKDGNQMCALFGINLQEGVAGFGDTIPEALRKLDDDWEKLDELLGKIGFGGYYDCLECLFDIIETHIPKGSLLVSAFRKNEADIHTVIRVSMTVKGKNDKHPLPTQTDISDGVMKKSIKGMAQIIDESTYLSLFDPDNPKIEENKKKLDAIWEIIKGNV